MEISKSTVIVAAAFITAAFVQISDALMALAALS